MPSSRTQARAPRADSQKPQVSSAIGLGVDDAAAAVNISRSTLYAEMNAGRIVSKKVGKRRIIPVAALHAWLAAQPNA